MAAEPAAGIRVGTESAAALPAASKRPVRYRVAGRTTIGLEPSRSANEDAYAYLTGYLAGEEGGQAWAMLSVADGMLNRSRNYLPRLNNRFFLSSGNGDCAIQTRAPASSEFIQLRATFSI